MGDKDERRDKRSLSGLEGSGVHWKQSDVG